MQQARPPGQIDQLTGIRFFAAFAVVFHHFYPRTGPLWSLHLLVNAGDAAVSLFFILSGFVLTISNRDATGAMRTSAGDFYLARFARIYPLYLFTFLFMAPFVVMQAVTSGESAGHAGLSVAVNAVAYLSLLQSWVPPLANAWVGPAWSLSDEAFFYAVFPWLAIPRTSRGLALLAAASAIAMIVPLAWYQWAGMSEMDGIQPFELTMTAIVRFFPALRVGEFLLGIVAARVFVSRPWSAGERRAAHWLALGLVALVVAAAAMADELVMRTVSTLAFPLLILALGVAKGPLASFLSTRPIVLLGEASFGLYLLQAPAAALYAARVTNGQPLRQMPAWHFASFAAFAIALSVCVHFLVERPGRQFVRAQGRRAMVRFEAQHAKGGDRPGTFD